jgi:probable F420-dependent oxidoreductase
VGVHPFRFGVLTKAPRSRATWTELARQVEALGYSTLLVPDHSRPQLAPFPALLAAAASTTTLRVGTLVANNDFRHPTVTAREALTVDLLSDGRLDLGLGAGWMRRDYEEAGLRWDRGALRVERFEEAVAIIRLMEEERPFDFDGRWYRLAEMQGGPAPVQRPLPLLIGAGGPRMLAAAAGSASIVSFGRSMAAGPTAADAAADAAREATERKLAILREAAAARFDRLELNVLLTSVEIGPGAWERARRHGAEVGLSAAAVAATPQHLLAADAEQAVSVLRERRDSLGISYFVVNELVLEAFAPVVSALAGT